MTKISSFSFKKLYLFIRTKKRIVLGLFFVLLLIFNILIFYQYIFLTTKAPTEFKSKETTIDNETLQKVLMNIEERQKTLQRVLNAEYSDPFQQE